MAGATHFDIIVLGVGSMGSAACWYAQRAGAKVLGLEQFDIPHNNGSYGGQSRIIRKAYYEHPNYVPLLERAYDQWHYFETITGQKFFHRTGIVYFGNPGHPDIKGIKRSASIHDIPVDNILRKEYLKRFDLFNVPEHFTCLYEPDAGFVTPSLAVAAYATASEQEGALIKKNTQVKKWGREGGKIHVHTSVGDFTSDKLIITAGAWTSRIASDLKSRLKVTRQLLAWVVPQNPEPFRPEKFPCWFVEDEDLGMFYGFPYVDKLGDPVGMKLAHHYPGDECKPEELHAPVSEAETNKIRAFLEKYMPSLGSRIVRTQNCLYTNSPDGHFIIDYLPGYERDVVVACGFSGHGFKFVPVIGEMLSDLAMKGETGMDVEFLRIER